MSKMKFYGCVGDGDPCEVEASDAEDAAEELAERYYEGAGESPEEDATLRVTVIGPDGAITVHDVVAQIIVCYDARELTDEPLPKVAAMLRAEVGW